MQIRIDSSEAGKYTYYKLHGTYCKKQCGSFAFLTVGKKLAQ